MVTMVDPKDGAYTISIINSIEPTSDIPVDDLVEQITANIHNLTDSINTRSSSVAHLKTSVDQIYNKAQAIDDMVQESDL